MSIDGLNVFGSLTVNGKNLKFEDFDTNKDGHISESEFTALLEREECDTLELSSFDANGDKVITEEEFADFEAKSQIQEALYELSGKIAQDFIGDNAKYASEAMAQLREFAKEFVASYTGNGDMVTDFKAVLPAKYEEIKNNILEHTPEAEAARAENQKQQAKSDVLDIVYETLYQELSKLYPDLAKDMTRTICKKLEAEANKFIASYTGESLREDLQAHLEEYMNTSDSAKMASAVEDYRNIFESMGGYLDENDLASLKEAAKEFLTEALNNGIILTLNGKKCSSEAQIEAALKGFSDAEELNNAIEKLIGSLSSESIKDSVINTKLAEKEAADAKALSELKGEDIHVETLTLDLSHIDGYYTNSREKFVHGWSNSSGAEDAAKKSALKKIESLKEQFKAQIKADLEAKGIASDKLDQVFENVFTQTSIEVVDSCVGYRNGWAKFCGVISYNTQELIDNFINEFNTNIANTINEMNKSTTDMDLQDIDYTLAVTDENGKVDERLLDGLKKNESVMYGGNKQRDKTNQMIDRMRGKKM